MCSLLFDKNIGRDRGVCWIFLVLLAATSPAIHLFYDRYIDPKWVLTVIVALLFCLNSFFSHGPNNIDRKSICFVSAVITLYLCSYCILCFILKNDEFYEPFENPNVLSIHLCLLLPFVHDSKASVKVFFKIAFYFIEVASILIIVITGCRSGMMCLMIFLLLKTIKGKWKYIIAPLTLMLGVFLATIVKQPSSLGRSFILRNTLELIKEAPLLGHGMNGFEREYMAKQAEYFQNHLDKDYAMLADDISHPLNEFLMVGVNYGMLGMIILLFVVTFPLFKKKSLFFHFNTLWISLLFLLVFCFFSYPLYYPLPWFIIGLSWYVIGRDVIERLLARVRAVLLPFIMVSLIFVVGYIYLLIEWGCASRTAKRGHSAEMMCTYEQVYPYLAWRSTFLYDYAIESFFAGCNQQALHLVEECKQKQLSYDLILLEGDICRSLHQYDSALTYYNEAMCMCPVRFAPLYGKWQAYKEMHDVEKQDSIRNVILHKDVKVYSPELQIILENVR